uniref:Uncharacterized protein n=1 Tax=Anguilla anguilla TaxID=7936 RepID=A0A0E9PZR0_ANGAN
MVTYLREYIAKSRQLYYGLKHYRARCICVFACAWSQFCMSVKRIPFKLI